jgi:hypothetical protein
MIVAEGRRWIREVPALILGYPDWECSRYTSVPLFKFRNGVVFQPYPIRFKSTTILLVHLNATGLCSFNYYYELLVSATVMNFAMFR